MNEILKQIAQALIIGGIRELGDKMDHPGESEKERKARLKREKDELEKSYELAEQREKERKRNIKLEERERNRTPKARNRRKQFIKENKGNIILEIIWTLIVAISLIEIFLKGYVALAIGILVMFIVLDFKTGGIFIYKAKGFKKNLPLYMMILASIADFYLIYLAFYVDIYGRDDYSWPIVILSLPMMVMLVGR